MACIHLQGTATPQQLTSRLRFTTSTSAALLDLSCLVSLEGSMTSHSDVVNHGNGSSTSIQPPLVPHSARTLAQPYQVADSRARPQSRPRRGRPPYPIPVSLSLSRSRSRSTSAALTLTHQLHITHSFGHTLSLSSSRHYSIPLHSLARIALFSHSAPLTHDSSWLNACS